MIDIEKIDKSFGRHEVLHQVSYRFEKARVYSLIGPNASGKTTLLKCILGLVRPDRGRITVDGQPVEGHYAYRSQIGYMPQISSFPESMTVRQVIDMIVHLRNHGATVNRELLEAYDLGAFYGKRMNMLSGGTRQKVNAALALMFDAAVLILDEPTAGLDPVSAATLKDMILRERQAGKLVLITTHNMADIDELSDQVVYLENGRILFSKTVPELKAASGDNNTGRGIRAFIRSHENAG